MVWLMVSCAYISSSQILLNLRASFLSFFDHRFLVSTSKVHNMALATKISYMHTVSQYTKVLSKNVLYLKINIIVSLWQVISGYLQTGFLKSFVNYVRQCIFKLPIVILSISRFLGLCFLDLFIWLHSGYPYKTEKNI